MRGQLVELVGGVAARVAQRERRGGLLPYFSQPLDLTTGFGNSPDHCSPDRSPWIVRMPNLTTAEAAAADGNDGSDPLACLPEPRGLLGEDGGQGPRRDGVGASGTRAVPPSHGSLRVAHSHRGWNSALESVQSGVPMITLPMDADQGMNAMILEERVGMALRPPAREDGIVVREEIADAVKELLLEGEKGREVRRRAGYMQQAAARAWSPEGSSHQALEEVAAKWKAACRNGK